MTDGSHGRVRALGRVAGAVAVVAVVGAGCGLPDGGTVRTVDDESVPYRLLESSAPEPSAPSSPGAPARSPVVLWKMGERLVPEASGAGCDEPAEDVVERLLAALAAGPSEDARADGRSTALPSDTGLALVALDDATAQVSLEADTDLSAELLPLAVGQVVLSVTSVPGVRSVDLVVDGEPVQVPLPEGVLTPGPVTAADYAGLLPDRLQRAGGVGCARR